MPPSVPPLDPTVRAVLDALEEPVLVIDRSMRIVLANDALRRKAGSRGEHVLGARCCEITHARQTPCWEAGEDCPVKRVFETGLPARGLHWHHDPQGQLAPDEIVASPLFDGAGKVVFVVEELRDASDMLRSRSVLEQMRQELDLLRGFVRICAHCKRVHKDDDTWEQLESYVSRHSAAEFSHGICPSCRSDVEEELARSRR